MDGQSHRTLLLERPKGCLVSEVSSVAVDGHGLQSEPGLPFSIHVDTSDSHQLGAGGSLTVLFLPDSHLGRESQSQRLQQTVVSRWSFRTVVVGSFLRWPPRVLYMPRVIQSS